MASPGVWKGMLLLLMLAIFSDGLGDSLLRKQFRTTHALHQRTIDLLQGVGTESGLVAGKKPG